MTFCGSDALCPLPASPTTVANFLGYLNGENLSVSTAKLYLSAVGNLHKEHGFPSPVRHTLVQTVLKGFCRKVPQPPDQRLPVTLDIMRFLKTQIAASSFCYHDQRLIWFAFNLAYFGFLRVGEFTTSDSFSYDSDRCLRFRDIYVSPSGSHLTVVIRKSKTDQHSFGHQVTIPATGRSICPVNACRKYFD